MHVGFIILQFHTHTHPDKFYITRHNELLNFHMDEIKFLEVSDKESD